MEQTKMISVFWFFFWWHVLFPRDWFHIPNSGHSLNNVLSKNSNRFTTFCRFIIPRNKPSERCAMWWCHGERARKKKYVAKLDVKIPGPLGGRLNHHDTECTDRAELRPVILAWKSTRKIGKSCFNKGKVFFFFWLVHVRSLYSMERWQPTDPFHTHSFFGKEKKNCMRSV